MDKFVAFSLKQVKALVQKNVFKNTECDDMVDRMNRAITVMILLICSFFTGIYQIFGKTVECWLPDPLSQHSSYINTYCFIANTYYLPLRDQIPAAIPSRENRELNYYQWVPILLIFMAFFFKLPDLFWTHLNNKTGIDMETLIQRAMKIGPASGKAVDDTIGGIAKHLNYCFKQKRLKATDSRRQRVVTKLKQFLDMIGVLFGRAYGHYLFGLYLFVKVLYLTNVTVQLAVMDDFLQSKNNTSGMYGVSLLTDLFDSHAWERTGAFPRVTFCDFEIKVLANLHRHTVQCALQINLFNEKIFTLLWFWLLIVCICSYINFVTWMLDILRQSSRLRYVRHAIKRADVSGGYHGVYDEALLKEFTLKYLKTDGVFVLKLIGKNTNDLIETKIILQLWSLYKKEKQSPEDNPKSK